MAAREPARSSGEKLRDRLLSAPGRDPIVPLVALLCIGVLGRAWFLRDELYFDPERGPGYALGIVGVACMSCLLLYSARKRLRVGIRVPLRHVFRFHMTLGVLAPTAILLHSNFALGSTNSTIALGCILLVAGSGFIGRFIYTRIHQGLFGRRRLMAEVRRNAAVEGSAVHRAISHAPELEHHLEAFEAIALDPRPKLAARVARFFTIGLRAGSLRREARHALRHGNELESAFDGVAHYLQSLCQVARFLDFERLFSLWHHAHVPLAFLLFAATAAHVLAVHMY